MEFTQEAVIDTPLEKQKQLYNTFSLDEETKRLLLHYDVDCEYFRIITGGLWNTYSCSIFENNDNLFENNDSMTQAQQRKLDLFAQKMQLKPSMRILDIGCGWGGPLTYLCHQYGVEGVGITVTPAQIPYARARAHQYQVDAVFLETHWALFKDDMLFDAIFTDEVMVHVNGIDAFFKKCHSLLKPNGRVVNKELHLSEERFKNWSDGLGRHVNQLFGFTGNYRLLDEEINAGIHAGFLLENIHTIDMAHYQKTVSQHWIKNLKQNRSTLERLTSKQHVDNFYKYLRCVMLSFRHGVFNNHMLCFLKKDE
jgi:cyclopropane-fatty-acyl-phospholipid synthase